MSIFVLSNTVCAGLVNGTPPGQDNFNIICSGTLTTAAVIGVVLHVMKLKRQCPYTCCKIDQGKTIVTYYVVAH